MVVPNQIIDRTTKRASTFFGNGLVVHVPFADPFCPVLTKILLQAGRKAGVTVHEGGTYVTVEGPQFSTRAESNLYRSWRASIIGMTVLPEARLAREAEICYASLALVTDYDCWYEASESVTASMIIETMRGNVDNAKKVIKLAAADIPEKRECACAEALRTSIVTAPDKIPASIKRDLALLLGKYLPLD
jgi:5'-methylthioadenosine phosphorylase